MRASVFTVTMSSLVAAACGGGPSSPSAAPTGPRTAVVAAAPGVTSIGAFAGASIVGASLADFARCLQSSGDAACFSGTRPIVRVATAGATAPGAPSSLSATSSGSSVTLTWSAPASGDPVVTYIIEAGSSSGLVNLANLATGSTATTFSTGGVRNGTYYVRIRAQNAAGTSAPSNEAILVVGDTGCTSAPNPPTGLASAVTASTVALTWSAPGAGCAPTSYVLQAGAASGSSALANSNVGNVTSYTATGIGAGTYYVRVAAANAFGQSAVSNEVIVTVGSTTTGVTGTWVGLVASGDGLSFSNSICSQGEQADLTLNLVQSGNTVTGTMTHKAVISPGAPNCDTVGVLKNDGSINGIVNGATISVNVPLFGYTCTGLLAGNRISGTCSAPGLTGTFAVSR